MKEFFDQLYQHRVSPNGLLVLHMIHTGEQYPNYINGLTEQQRLSLSGHLLITQQGDQRQVSLTDKGRHVLADLEKIMLNSPKVKKVKAIPFEQWEENIKIYLSLFPAGNQGSAPIKSPAKSLYTRFQWFFATYPEYDWVTVLTATDAYLKSLEQSEDGFKYISTSKYFIKKQENDKTNLSRLADWCQTVKEGTLEQISELGKQNFKSDVV